MTIKRYAATLAVLSACGFCYGTAYAGSEADGMVRASALYLKPANQSDAGTGNAGITSAVRPADGMAVNGKTFPALDISYFFTPRVAAGLVLDCPQKQPLGIGSEPLSGLESPGNCRQVRPAPGLRYHGWMLQPDVGAGLNCTRISGINLNAGTHPLQLSASSRGPARGAGGDMRIAEAISRNLGVENVYIESDVPLANTRISRVRPDPLAVGAGVDWRV